MVKLQKIHDKRYCYYDKPTKTLYTLKYGDRGVYGRGKSWYLKMKIGESKDDCIATFTVKTDCNYCEKEDYGGRLWTDDEAFREATRIIEKSILIMS